MTRLSTPLLAPERGRMVALTCGAMAAGCTLGLFILSPLDATGNTRLLMTAAIGVYAALCALALWTPWKRGVAAAMCTAFFVFVVATAAWVPHGTLITPPFALLLPVLVILMLGRRAGIVAGLVVTVFLGVLFERARADDGTYLAFTVASTLLATLLLLGVMVAYEVRIARTLSTLHRAMDQHQRAEAARRGSEEAFRRLVEGATELIILHRDGLIVYCNPALTRMLGYAQDALVGTPVHAIIHADDLRRMEQRHTVLRSGQRIRDTAELRVKDTHGEYHSLETTAFLLEHEGRPAIAAIGRDLTERRRMEAQLSVADRLAAVGTLAAGTAHELNNPLAFVAANLIHVAQGLAERSRAQPDDAQLREWLEALGEANQGAARMAAIIRDLKSFSAHPDGAVRVVAVARVVEHVLTLAGNELRHRARVTLEIPADLHVRGDDTRLSQVLLHLLMNAAQAIPPGHADANEISLRATVHAHDVTLSVRDSGGGIPPEDLKRLFDPFFTRKQVGEGRGLGLFICHNLVRSMGGEIAVESEPGHGTQFHVTLPRATAAATPDPDGAHDLGGRRRIAVIDDDPLVVSAVRRLLHDHEVIGYTDANVALGDLLDGVPCDAVLCDLMMPSLPGSEFVARLHEKLPALARRTVFVTGGAFTPEAQAFLDTGVRVVEKPFDGDSLRSALAQVLRAS